MSCSLPLACLLVILGTGSSAGGGILGAELGNELGNINKSFQIQDVALFDSSIKKVVLYVLIMVALQGLSTFCMKYIGLMKRIHLNRYMHSVYLKNKTFYVLNAFHSDHCDCVDSRLTSDIETMTTELYSIVQTVVSQVASFIYAMTLLSSDPVALIGLLCLCLFSVLLIGIIYFFFKRTSSSVSQLKKDEGLFIFQHTRIKKHRILQRSISRAREDQALIRCGSSKLSQSHQITNDLGFPRHLLQRRYSICFCHLDR
jgi:ABC-type uncharacterized transport system fused permease/ATPase subunit